ncbi:acyl-CoA dehydrogenase [Streptomyces cinnamoneus]|uniref:Acyl-CoA dehydrogenase n=1 Tax=Streptomyces cinnamoneus TaxID=53446 RepID=A0A2G1XIR8_STRCJ|nr:acyl-CoA dehydrogenase family protein [Streptomyces cinnamoneus]PHQ51115.1 acyl-CoA dehydrogenase [Streptomyces cinnamoneus]PPT13662.1 acyl-CoA dehydrogenase [Streptomyces cinnamoneus]
MDAAFSEEQAGIRAALRELLLKRCGVAEVRAAVLTPAGHDEGLWRQLAERLGLAGLAVEQRYGGVGCGPTELALAGEETGRALLPSPLLATTALATPLIASLGTTEQRAELLPRLASGELTAALALPGAPLPVALGLVGPEGAAPPVGGRAGGVQARRTPDGWRLYGEAGQVLDGHSAGLLIVAAHTGGYVDGRALLFLVRPAEARGVVRARLTVMDETRPQARVQLRDVRAELLGARERDAWGVLAALGGPVAAVLAAEAVGVADAALERTVGYARVREQFGRPIGSFQAVKHRLADLHVAVQGARSAAYYAAWAAGGGQPPSGAAAVGGLALAQALETAWTVTGEAIQLHGGIGVTWEHDVQLYFKRAASDALLFGPVHRLRARAAEAAGLFAVTDEREAVVL